jgi:GDP-L-fucose synthase
LTVKDDVEWVVRGADIVIHTAAVTSGLLKYKAESDVTDNIIMNSLIIQSCFDFNVEHFMYPSCTIMYSSSEIPVKESDYVPGNYMHPKYFLGSRMKKLAEDMCEMFAQSSQCSTKFTVFRHSNIYGPYDKFSLELGHVFAATLTKVMSVSDGGTIDIFGTGEDKRDLLYVGDLLDFIDRALGQESRFELLNVGYGESISISDLCYLMLSIACKRDVEVKCELEPGSVPKSELALDCSKANSVFGWKPCVGLADGIRKTMEAYERS